MFDSYCLKRLLYLLIWISYLQNNTTDVSVLFFDVEEGISILK